MRDVDLMRLHVEAEFTHDAAGRLVRVNEPNGAPAPRFFLGRTVDGVVRRYRHDVRDAVRDALDEVAAGDERSAHEPIDPAPYVAILGHDAPVQHSTSGVAFRFPREVPASGAPASGAPASGAHAAATPRALRDADDAALLRPLLPAWEADVPHCQPFVALLLDGRAVAVACSVRVTPLAHEAGVETAPAYRGRGYAPLATAAWAALVRAAGAEPLYSTSWQNAASRAVARALALVPFGSDLHIT